MSGSDLLIERWSAGQFRIEAGIFFADDRVVLLEGDPGAGYREAGRASLHDLAKEKPDDWAELELCCSAANDRVRVSAGGGSWEGEGYVALFDIASSRLSWLLHLDSSEVFTEIVLREAEVIVMSEDYPIAAVWRIPLADPVDLQVFTRKM